MDFLYIQKTPEVIDENHLKVELVKYRGPLGAYFITYEMNYKDNK